MTEHGLLEIELEVITQVGTTKDLATAAAAATGTEDIPEDVAKDVS